MKTCGQVNLNGITTMITWLLLVSLFCESSQDGNSQQNGVLHCEPQNLTAASSDKTITVTWKDEPSCSSLQDGFIYELLVLIADEQVHHEEVAMTPEQTGSTHSWSWTSTLVLECASVRLRSRYNMQTSPWKQEQALPAGIHDSEIEVFPRDKLLEVGSKFTFCCFVPAWKQISTMSMYGYDDSNMNMTKVSNQTYVLTVHLNVPTRISCTNVECQSTEGNSSGTCAYIGYQPGDRDLQCETRDLQSVECRWEVGQNTHLPPKGRTVYHLLGRNCTEKSMEINGSVRKCKMDNVQVDAGERNWTLTATNALGKVVLSDPADLTKRVHMYKPDRVMASNVNARNVTVEWGWTVPQYSGLNITCQVHISHRDAHAIHDISGVGVHLAVLNDLIPHWRYHVKVRCGTTLHLWKWSDWSQTIDFQTLGDVPDALDVWMQVRGDNITVVWKELLANQSHGHIKDYEVTWSKSTERKQENRTTVRSKTSLDLSLDTAEEYVVTVTARNENGSSSPSTITIPPGTYDGTETVKTSWILGSSGGFDLSWSASPAASCGYIVDWCPTSGHCEVEWLKVPPNETTARVTSGERDPGCRDMTQHSCGPGLVPEPENKKTLRDGVRYSLSVYACTQGAPMLLERREGYVREKRIEDGLFEPLNWKQLDTDVTVKWKLIDPRKQSALIRGYVLLVYLLANNSLVMNVSTEDLNATSLTAENLEMTSYTFTVKAQTAVGECGTTSTPVTLNTTDNLVGSVIISLVTVFSLLSLITILCYRHWTCIKRKVYPPIPKPALTDEWLTSPGENSFCPIGPHEAETVAVSGLYFNSETLERGYNSQKEDTLFVYAQTPKGYYNQPLKKHVLPPLALPPTAIPSHSGLPSSPFRAKFLNPSYNLALQTGDQQSDPGPELQEGPALERSSSGYQPQTTPETFTVNQMAESPDSPMSCVSTYVLLPQLAST